MRLKKIIHKLVNIEKKKGDIEVIMADNAPVVNVIFSKKYPSRKSVIITDEKIKGVR